MAKNYMYSIVDVPSCHPCLAMASWNDGIEPRTFFWWSHKAARYRMIGRCHLDWSIWWTCLYVRPPITFRACEHE